MFRFQLGKFRIGGPDPRNPNQPHKQYANASVTAGGALVTTQGEASVDAFGRNRVGNPYTVFDNKNVYWRHESFWGEDISGGGAITYLQAESAVELSVGTASGDHAIRQSLPHPPYAPGKSHEGTQTFVMGPIKTNVVSRAGLFTVDNGVFIERNETDERLVIRTDTSGSPVDTNFKIRSEWNIDKLDGSGPSGVTIDFSKTQIFFYDLQWLGVGRVRFGFDFGAGPIYVHEFQNANNNDKVYMRTPNLPIRFEIRNVGVSPSASSMKEICSVITSNGGYSLPGFDLSQSNGVTTRAVTVKQPLMAIRLKNSFKGLPNRAAMRLIDYWVYSADEALFFELAHLHEPTSIVAPNWQSAGPNSPVEYSTELTGITGNPEHIISSGVAPASSVGNNTIPAHTEGQGDFRNGHNVAYQNFGSDNSQVFVIYGTSMSGIVTGASAGVIWRQIE